MHHSQARSQGGGRPPPPPPPPKKKGESERKKENKVACMRVKLPPFNHFQSKIKYKFVLYEENTGHMHQIAPLTTSKCKKLSLWEGRGDPSHTPPPPPRSLRSLARYFYRPPKIKSWLRHWPLSIVCWWWVKCYIFCVYTLRFRWKIGSQRDHDDHGYLQPSSRPGSIPWPGSIRSRPVPTRECCQETPLCLCPFLSRTKELYW